jgi:hypothetical protein
MKYGARIVRLCANLVLSWGPNLLTAEEPTGPLAGLPTEQEILAANGGYTLTPSNRFYRVLANP